MIDPEAAKERFLSKVNKEGEHVFGMGQTCWQWIGAHDDKGRPRFKMDGRSMNANRAWLILDGWEIGPKDHVITFCRQHGCVNPAHHVIGSPMEAKVFEHEQLQPFNQSVLRGAFMAKKLKIETVMYGYELSARVAKAMLIEDPTRIRAVVHPSA